MEEIIELRSFNIEKLKKLSIILENNQIKKINNNLKSEDKENKIVIEYDKKIIKLNEKFSLKVKLIRNRYYRQLLNIVNIIKDVDEATDKYNSEVKKYQSILKKDYILSMVGGLDDLWPIESNDYDYLLKMALINYIGVYNFDNIFELTKDEMLELRKYRNGEDNKNNYTEYLNRALGMYCHYNEKIFELLEPKVDRSELEKMKKCNRFIFICPEIIREFCIKHFDKFEECGISDVFELYIIIFNKVLVHEIGHGVFEYIKDYEDENRANYFASITFDGTLDQVIKKQTDIQKGSYKNPRLIDDDISEIKKYIYNIS